MQELRSFLGLVNYYGRFIPNLATVARPLNMLLRKNCQWKWSGDQAQAFDRLKNRLASADVFTHYDVTLPLKLACDASWHGIDTLVAQLMSDGLERPIAYASRSLTKTEENYAQIEKEALGIILGVKTFYKFLYGRKFLLVTDHKALTTML